MEENIPTANTMPEPPIVPDVKNKTSLFPPKRTVALIVILILITGGLVYLSVSNYQQPNNQVVQKDSQAFKQTTFELTQPAEDSASTQSATPIYFMDINMKTGTNNVDAVQFELEYNPTALTDINIVPGEATKDWAGLVKNIDTEKGIIYYSLGVNLKQKGINGSKNIAKITFSKAQDFAGDTIIRFLSKTKATAEGYDKSVLKSTSDGPISFPSVE